MGKELQNEIYVHTHTHNLDSARTICRSQPSRSPKLFFKCDTDQQMYEQG